MVTEDEDILGPVPEEWGSWFELLDVDWSKSKPHVPFRKTTLKPEVLVELIRQRIKFQPWDLQEKQAYDLWGGRRAGRTTRVLIETLAYALTRPKITPTFVSATVRESRSNLDTMVWICDKIGVSAKRNSNHLLNVEGIAIQFVTGRRHNIRGRTPETVFIDHLVFELAEPLVEEPQIEVARSSTVPPGTVFVTAEPEFVGRVPPHPMPRWVPTPDPANIIYSGPTGMTYRVDEPETSGVMPVRAEPQVVPADTPRSIAQVILGWAQGLLENWP